MKDILFGLYIICLVIGIVLLTNVKAEFYINYNVGINVREGPGLDFDIIGHVKPGDVVDVFNSQRGWVKIRRKNSKLVGWVARSFVGEGKFPVYQVDSLKKMLKQREDELENIKREKDRLQEIVGTIPKNLLSQQYSLDEAIKRQIGFYDRVVQVKWFLAGAIVFFAGWIIGYLAHRSLRKPQRRLSFK